MPTNTTTTPNRRRQRRNPNQLDFRGRATRSVAVLVAFLVALLIWGSTDALAQTKRFHMERYDSDITVNADSSLDVDEKLVYVYDAGSYHRGLREIPLARLGTISDVRVVEELDGQSIAYRETSFDPDSSSSGRPGTFGTEETGGKLRIRWVYDYTAGASRTFHEIYHVTGAIRVYVDHDEFDWYAVPPDWQGPIYASRVRVTFPTGDASALTFTSRPTSEAGVQGGSVVWSSSGNLDGGFEVGAKMPKGMVQAAKQPWQEEVDQQEVYQVKIRPLVDLAALLGSVLILVGGILAGMVRWQTKGRDKPVQLPADYLTEPPGNLPPGLVGTLLDEQADIRDVIATVVDQGRKGNLTIREVEQGGLFAGRDYEYTHTGNKVDFEYEQMVLNALFGSGDVVRLSELKNKLYSSLPAIYDSMYKSLVALKYFPENPKSVRARNQGLGCFIFVLGVAAFFALTTMLANASTFGFGPGIALGLVGIVWFFLGASMPRKTDMGSEQAARWRAFARYLQQMQRYTDVQAAADKFQHYLPYAVALNVERQLTRQFESVPSAMPTYYSPYGWFPTPVYMGGGTGGGGNLSGGQSGSSGPVPSFDPGGAMQGMSNSLASAMQGMSDSFTSMVNSASSAFTSQPSSSGSGGGGWGGGGGGFGGGGGGGGGGGAD